MLKRLGELLQHGYSLSDAIQFLSVQLEEKYRKELTLSLGKLKEGESLYHLFSTLQFHHDLLGYLYFAEKHGDVSNALLEGGKMLERKLHHLDAFRKMVRYPAFLFLFVSGMFVIIYKVLLPQFQGFYKTMNYEATILTNVVSTFSTLQRFSVGLLLLLICSSSLYYFLRYKHLPESKKMKLLLNLPIIRFFLVLLNSHFFSIQLSNLLKGGLSIYESLSMFEQQKHSRFFQEEAKEMKRLLSEGERLDEIVNARGFYERELSLIITHGQTNGALSKELYMYSQYAFQRMEERISKILSTLQPILFSVIGMMVILMYAIIMLPMFQLINSI